MGGAGKAVLSEPGVMTIAIVLSKLA
ncbi:hypothetical protein EVA_19636, partial [gut metagenome]